MYMDVCVTFYFVSFFLVMLKCYGYQHNYILMYAVWWLINVRCTWDGLDPCAPMTRWLNEVPPKKRRRKVQLPVVFMTIWMVHSILRHIVQPIYDQINAFKRNMNWMLHIFPTIKYQLTDLISNLSTSFMYVGICVSNI